jgi:hypothetical protein
MEDITSEVLVVDKDIAGIRGDTAGRVWSSTTDHILQINSGLTQALHVRDLQIRVLGSATRHALFINSLDSAASFTFTDMVFDNSAAGTINPVNISVAPSAADQFLFDRCYIIGEANYTLGAVEIASTTQDSAVIFRNCVIQGNAAGEGIRSTGSTGNTVLKLYNNTIVGHQTGIETNHTIDARNNIFANNSSADLALGGSASTADYNYCAFETQAGSFGTGNIFGIDPDVEFTNPGGNDYTIDSGATTIDDGTDLSGVGVTVDITGASRPNGLG